MILSESNEHITIFFMVLDRGLRAICSVSARHKCGTAAAQGRTKIPVFCMFKSKSAHLRTYFSVLCVTRHIAYYHPYIAKHIDIL